MSLKMLRFCLAIIVTLLISSSKTSTVNNVGSEVSQLTDQLESFWKTEPFMKAKALSKTLSDILIAKNSSESLVKSPTTAVNTRDISSAVGDLFTELVIPALNFFQDVWIANLVTLFATLNGTTYLWSYPNIYFPILAIYVVLLIISGISYLITNAFADDPDSFDEILNTFWNSYILEFLWSFYPF